MFDTPNLSALVAIATKVEAVARTCGYHVGITGSCLYGREGGFPHPEDMDILLYWHSGRKPEMRPFNFLVKCGFKHIHELGDYAENDEKMGADPRTREVFSARLATGVKVDFIFLRA